MKNYFAVESHHSMHWYSNRGVGVSSPASTFGWSRCSSEYVTAKDTTIRQMIATAIRDFVQGDIGLTSFKGEQSIA